MPRHNYDFTLSLTGPGGFKTEWDLCAEAKITEGTDDKGSPCTYSEIIQIGIYSTTGKLEKHSTLDAMLWHNPALHRAIVKDWKGG